MPCTLVPHQHTESSAGTGLGSTAKQEPSLAHESSNRQLPSRHVTAFASVGLANTTSASAIAATAGNTRAIRRDIHILYYQKILHITQPALQDSGTLEKAMRSPELYQPQLVDEAEALFGVPFFFEDVDAFDYTLDAENLGLRQSLYRSPCR